MHGKWMFLKLQRLGLLREDDDNWKKAPPIIIFYSSQRNEIERRRTPRNWGERGKT